MFRYLTRIGEVLKRFQPLYSAIFGYSFEISSFVPLKRVKGVKRERVQAKVTTVYRKKWCIYVDKKTKEKQNGQTVNIPVVPSTCRIEKLMLNTDRKEYIEKKAAAGNKLKNKNTGN